MPPAPTVVSGATATAEEMAEVRRQIQAFYRLAEVYRDCLKGEFSQKAVGHTGEERKAMSDELVATYTPVWVKVRWLSDCFNVEQKSFDQSGGGKKGTPADCGEYAAKAAQAASVPGTPATAGATDDSGFSEPKTLPTGSWRYRIVRGGTPEPCRYRGKPECVASSIEVDNSSRETLECQSSFALDGVSNEGLSHAEMRGVLLARTRRVMLKTLLPTQTVVKSGVSECTPRAPLPPLPVPKECALQIVRTVNLTDYYPPTARRLSEEGPVAMQFTLKSGEGSPTDITVIGSSLSDRLDAAAVKALGDMVLKTACPERSFRLQLVFKLE